MNKDIFLRNAKYRIEVENWQDSKDEIIEDDYTPFETCARYFSDFIREREWFLDL